MGILMLGGLGAVRGWAQMPQLKRPEEPPAEQPAPPPPKKLVNEPRAIGLLQLNKSGKGTLIPIAIRIDGKFYDASAYKANPVPMALDGGTVYEVEKTGQSEGLFTVSGALHNQNPNSATPWLGAGQYVLNGTVAANKIHRAEDTPRGIEGVDNGPPRLTRGAEGNQSPAAGSGGASGASQKSGTAAPAGESSGGSGSPTSSTSAGSGTGSAGAGSSGGSSADDDSGRPRLKRAGDPGSGTSQDSQSQTSGGQGSSAAKPSDGVGQSEAAPSAGSSGASGSGGPNQASAGQAGPNQTGQSQTGQGQPPAQNQSGQNYYRPVLRRGKPTQSAPDDTPEELTRTTETESPAKAPAGGDNAIPVKPALLLVPAISDAGGPLPESFQFFWKESEEGDRQKQMLDLAADSVRSYLSKLAKDTIPAKPVASTSTANKRVASTHKPVEKVEPEFENVEFRAFDVWRNNQPVMVLTAEAHLPQKPGADTNPMTYYVTLAARTDIYGDVRKLYSGVTDKFHLDVTPKLELIDALDADGDGRGELLFRETTDAGNGYLIYRPTGDTLWKMFDSLNQE